MLQAVIMAAGRSTRTQPLTSTRPKPLVPLWNRPLLEHQLAQLEGLTDEVILVVGYRQEQIEAFARDRKGGPRLRLVTQEHQRGTADALLAARPHLKDEALVINGDDFYHRDDLRALAARGPAILVTTVPDPQNRAVVELSGERVVDIVEKPPTAPPDALCSIGAYALRHRDLGELDRLTPSVRGELELPDLIRTLAQAGAVRYHRVERIWFPITYAWDALGIVLSLWREPERAASLGLSTESKGSLMGRRDLRLGEGILVEGPVALGSGTEIGAGVRIVGPVSLGRDCRVEAGARIEASVLFDGVQVGEGTRVRYSVLGSGVRLGSGVAIEALSGQSLSVTVKGRELHPEIERLGLVAGDRASLADGSRVAAGTVLPARS